MLKKIGLIVLCFAMIAVAYTMMEINTVFSGKESVTLTVQKGDTLHSVIPVLKEQKAIGNTLLFKLYCKLQKDSTVMPGTIVIPKSASYKEILTALKEPAKDDISVTIPEGLELREIADKLESAGLIDRNKFLDIIENGAFDYPFLKDAPKGENRLEGFLFPDTYLFSKTLNDEKSIITKMLDRFGEIYGQEQSKRASELKMTDFQIITLASIIEREGKTHEDFYQISAVFHNRLKKGMPLQSCATVQYILKERKNILSEEDTKINSPYNTYLHNGLPTGPISSPGQAAIDAALHPADSDALYFLNDANGKLHFSATYAEHQNLMKQYGLR